MKLLANEKIFPNIFKYIYIFDYSTPKVLEYFDYFDQFGDFKTFWIKKETILNK